MEGNTASTLLGKDVDKGEMLQYVVPPDRWFGAITAPGTEYSLVGCTVAPGFVFETLVRAEHDVLLREFPQAKEWIDSTHRWDNIELQYRLSAGQVSWCDWLADMVESVAQVYTLEKNLHFL